VVSKHTKTLRECYHSNKMYEFFQRKYKWGESLTNKIWWEINGKSLLNFGEAKQTTLQKYIHDRLPCNHRESKYYDYRNPICRACKDNIETIDHILQCDKCNKRVKLRDNYLKN
jgi:hypothetical protein